MRDQDRACSFVVGEGFSAVAYLVVEDAETVKDLMRRNSIEWE